MPLSLELIFTNSTAPLKAYTFKHKHDHYPPKKKKPNKQKNPQIYTVQEIVLKSMQHSN